MRVSKEHDSASLKATATRSKHGLYTTAHVSLIRSATVPVTARNTRRVLLGSFVGFGLSLLLRTKCKFAENRLRSVTPQNAVIAPVLSATRPSEKARLRLA